MRSLSFLLSLVFVGGCSSSRPAAVAQTAPVSTTPVATTPVATTPVATVSASTTPSPSAAPSRKWSVLGSFPHDTKAFTEGLLWHGGKLYESTGDFGKSSLRRVDLQSGQVERRFDLPRQWFGEGLALANGRFYQLTWQTKRGFVYDQNFKPLAQFSYQNEGWGLTYDGKSLVQSDGTNVLTWRDPKTFAGQKQVKVTWNGRAQRNLNELEWIDGKIWANVWQTDWIVIINPATGKVESFLDLSGLLTPQDRSGKEDVLNGIAYDAANQRLFVTGKNWSKLFWLRVE